MTLEARLRHEDDRRSTSPASRRSSARCATSSRRRAAGSSTRSTWREQRRVVFLGDKLAEDIFGKDVDAVGKTVLLEQLAVPRRRRAGEQGPGLELQRPRQREGASSPARRSARSRATSTSTTSSSRPKVVGETEAGHRATCAARLGRRLRFDPKDKEAISMWDTTEQFKFFDIFLLSFNAFLGIIGVAHADRRRHRRLEHHERRRRGAHQARSASRWRSARETALDPAPVPARDAADHRPRRRVRLRDLVRRLRASSRSSASTSTSATRTSRSRSRR